MNDTYHFLGLPQSQWQFINTFAEWVSAIGMVATVSVSLWLARSATRPKATFKCTLITAFAHGQPEGEYVNFSIVNTGDRPIRVINIGWKIGVFKKRWAIQLADSEPYMNSPLPVDLTHGQTANWFVNAQEIHRGTTWVQDFAQKMIAGRHAAWNLRSLRAHAYTSTGHKFSAKPADDILKALRGALSELSIKEDAPEKVNDDRAH